MLLGLTLDCKCKAHIPFAFVPTDAHSTHMSDRNVTANRAQWFGFWSLELHPTGSNPVFATYYRGGCVEAA